jgi:hypothetical protein
MAVTTIAFLILLGGTSAEHIIAMPSMSECRRAAESVNSFQCLTADEFDARIQNVGSIQSDIQTASTSPDPVAMPSGTPEVKPLDGTPSALKRQVRKALNPEMSGINSYPAKRGVNEQGNARIIIAEDR